MNPTIQLCPLDGFLSNQAPEYETSGSAGFDLRAACENEIYIKPGKTALIPTGLAMAIPEGYELQIRPRSGLALKDGVTVLNTPGTIDSDYRGHVQVILANLGQRMFVVAPGNRIAQAVLAPVIQAQFEYVTLQSDLGQTQRGEGGFGSTGTH